MTKPDAKFEYVSSATLPTRWGKFCIHGFVEIATQQEHVALSYGEWQPSDVVPIRVHSECLTGDALFSTHYKILLSKEKAYYCTCDKKVVGLVY
jgi:GTP cyclohydrolase II